MTRGGEMVYVEEIGYQNSLVEEEFVLFEDQMGCSSRSRE